MKKFISIFLALSFVLSLVACSSKSIGKISGAENEYITIDDVVYVRDWENGNGFGISDRGTYLGEVSNGTITMKVYSVKGDAAGGYIYTLWDWEGAIYKRQEP